MYYRGSAAAIIVYDITKEVRGVLAKKRTVCERYIWVLLIPSSPFQETFSTLKNWVKELRQHGPPNIVVAIAGNKCDLNDAR